MTITTTENYRRALGADRKLQALDYTVRALADLMRRSRRSGEPFCAGCVWETVVKPLTLPLVGWSRGRIRPVRDQVPPDPAEGEHLRLFPAEPGSSWEPVDMAKAVAEVEGRRAELPKLSETERWLRSSEAFDAVTDVWLDLLERADPGKGHGAPDLGSMLAQPVLT